MSRERKSERKQTKRNSRKNTKKLPKKQLQLWKLKIIKKTKQSRSKTRLRKSHTPIKSGMQVSRTSRRMKSNRLEQRSTLRLKPQAQRIKLLRKVQ